MTAEVLPIRRPLAFHAPKEVYAVLWRKRQKAGR